MVLAGGQRLFDGLLNRGIVQAARKAQRDGMADMAERDVLQSQPTKEGRPHVHHHRAVLALDQHAFGFQLGVRLGHDLRVGQQLLRPGAIFFQICPFLQGPGRDMNPDLARELLVDRNR